MTLARHFEESSRPNAAAITKDEGVVVDAVGKPLTPSEALRQRHQHLRSLHTLASQFGARLVDVSDHSVIVEMTGKTARVEAFLALVKPYGIIESARTGAFFFFLSSFERALGAFIFFFYCADWADRRVNGYAAYADRWIGRGRRIRPRRLCRCELASSRLDNVQTN